MLNTIDTFALEQAHSSGTYIKRDLQIVRGEGASLWDEQGRRYIDLVAGQGAANLGHCHPAIVSAIQRQAAELITCPELFHNPIRAQYQAALCAAAQMPRVFLCNSGAEAVEGALKIARLVTGKSGVISTMRGFHGRTMGALSTTWEKKYREPFAPLPPGVIHVPYNNLEKMRAALEEGTRGLSPLLSGQLPETRAGIGAVILEPVQGEGGVHPADPGYLQGVQQLCREFGALLIIDEVQTGFGRTGTLFAHEQDGVQPDLLCLAKSIAGGVPMGAVLMGERVGSLPAASHGSTFGGNPLACAAAFAALEVYQHTDLIPRASTLGAQVITHLRANLPDAVVREVRGRGFLIGIELRDKVAPVLKALQERGVLALPAGMTVLRLLPPLVISDDDLWQAVNIIEEVLYDGV